MESAHNVWIGNISIKINNHVKNASRNSTNVKFVVKILQITNCSVPNASKDISYHPLELVRPAKILFPIVIYVMMENVHNVILDLPFKKMDPVHLAKSGNIWIKKEIVLNVNWTIA